jgi:hypothetical protein
MSDAKLTPEQIAAGLRAEAQIVENEGWPCELLTTAADTLLSEHARAEALAADYSTLSAKHHDTEKNLAAFIRDTPYWVQRAEKAESVLATMTRQRDEAREDLAKADKALAWFAKAGEEGIYSPEATEIVAAAKARHAARQRARRERP